MNKERLLRLDLFESYRGHIYGWDLILQNRKLARLSNAAFHEMFWTEFKVTALTDNPEDLKLMNDSEFWQGGEFILKNCALHIETTSFLSVLLTPFPNASVKLRGFPIEKYEPTLWEQVLLIGRRMKRRFGLKTQTICEPRQ